MTSDLSVLVVMVLAAAVWCIDFEFTAPPGERPTPICLVAHDIVSGQRIRQWLQPAPPNPPFAVDDDSLFVAYMATAELSCFLALGWPVPTRWLDLYVEFRNLTNGILPPGRRSLLRALEHYGIAGIDAAEKTAMRQLAERGGPYTLDEQLALLAYCATDVDALVVLLPAMLPKVDVRRAIEIRGRYLVATARMEHAGVPIDVGRVAILRARWADVQQRLMMLANYRYEHVFHRGRFSTRRFERYLERHGIVWPRLESGRPALDEKTFRLMVRARPELAQLRDARLALSQLRAAKLAVGNDGRNRTMLSPFASRTGRSQPSNSKFIFGPSMWLRGLIQPAPGMALAYIDWRSAEFGIAAALSGDRNMVAAYVSGDPYIHFARLARETEASSIAKRAMYKICALALLYGMGAKALGEGIEDTVAQARWLMSIHRKLFRQFWTWSDCVSNMAALYGQLETDWGWTLHLPMDTSETVAIQRMTAAKMDRTARNFPVQAMGAEMLRLAISEAQDLGVRVIAPVHDAVLIEAPADDIEAAATTMREAMAGASRVVLGGFELRSKVDQVVRHPDRYMDEERGRVTWDAVWKLLGLLP